MAQPKITDSFPNFLNPQESILDQLSPDLARQSAPLAAQHHAVDPVQDEAG